MNDWKEAKESTLKEKRETKEASIKQTNTFKPIINKKSLQLAVRKAKARPIGERLGNTGA